MKKLLLFTMAATLFMMACRHPATSGNTAPANLTAPNPSAPVPAGADSAVTTNGPQMKFQYVTHDFGKIKQGDKVTYQFNFTNSGKSPLIVSNAVASCGCTKPEWPQGPIGPGSSGQITVTFNSTGKSGLQDKMITITANTNPPQNVVHLVGEVTK